MKKLIAVMMIAAIMIPLISGCKNESESETTTPEMTKEIITELNSETEEFTEHDKAEESTTEHPIEYIKSEKIKIDDGNYQYTIEKKPFEDNYTEEFLMGLSEFYNMEFGLKDYDNWNGDPNEVLNDLLIDGSVDFKWLDYNSPEWNKAKAEMENNPYNFGDVEYGFTTVDNINNGIKKYFGPDAREFYEDDFDTYDEIKTSDASVFEDYDLNYRFAYLPESNVVVQFVNEFFEGGAAAFVCDVKTIDNCCIVETVMGSEYFSENGYTFEGCQTDALTMFNRYTYGRLFRKIFTIAVDENNNMYMVSVDKSYILPENIKANYKVLSDNVKVEARKYASSEWKAIDTLSKGDEVYSGTMYYLYEDYVWISTEEYEGRVERKYLTPIE